MNEHYALDPDAPLDARELKLLMDQFGLSTGRFLAQYPEQWPKMLLQRMQAASELDRQRALELLRRPTGCLVRAVARFDPSRAWANNAAVSVARDRIFEAVIGQRGNGFGWPSPEQVLYDDTHALPPGQGAHVPMSAARYAELARPLFLASAEVILVDPYFSLHDKQGRRCQRRWPVLQSLLTAADAVGTCQCLRLVLERKQILATAGSEARLEDALAEALTKASISRLELDYEVREEVDHGRYLFSIHGGLQFDRGFEQRSNAQNHIHWMTRPELQPLLDRFARRTNLVIP